MLIYNVDRLIKTLRLDRGTSTFGTAASASAVRGTGAPVAAR